MFTCVCHINNMKFAVEPTKRQLERFSMERIQAERKEAMQLSMLAASGRADTVRALAERRAQASARSKAALEAEFGSVEKMQGILKRITADGVACSCPVLVPWAAWHHKGAAGQADAQPLLQQPLPGDSLLRAAILLYQQLNVAAGAAMVLPQLDAAAWIDAGGAAARRAASSAVREGARQTLGVEAARLVLRGVLKEASRDVAGECPPFCFLFPCLF